MKTLSIHKEEKTSTTQAKWWNSKNVFFSTFTGEEFTNKEVVLTHLFLISLLTCAACIETFPIVATLAMGIGAVCVRLLNRVSRKNH